MQKNILWPSQIRDRILERQPPINTGHHRSVEFYQSLPWREAVLTLLSESSLTGAELMYLPSKFTALVHTSIDHIDTQEIEKVLLDENKSILSLFLVEWRFGVFKKSIIEDNWKTLIDPIENFWEAKSYLKVLLQEAFKDSKFEKKFKLFCRNVFAESKENPARFLPDDRREKQQLIQLIANWKSEQSLSKLWWVERELGYLMPFADDCDLIEFVIALDTKFAIQLLESFENPYQPMAILTYQLHLATDFEAWAQLFEASTAAFDSKGQWKGNLTSILLYIFLEDALSQHYIHGIEEGDDASTFAVEIEQLCEHISSLISRRLDAGYFSFFVASEVFRTTLATLERENRNFPTEDGRAWPLWKLIEGVSNTKPAEKWPGISALGSLRADKLCQLSVKIIAENNRDLPISGMQEILDLFPTKPENLLDRTDAESRSEISQFMVFSKRPDAFGFRIISMAFTDSSRAANYELLWDLSSTTRELIEFEKLSYSPKDDNHSATINAKDLLSLVIGIGVSLIENCLDHRIEFTIHNRHDEATKLFQVVFSSILEMTAIETRGSENYTSMLSYLLNQRALTWVEHPRNKEVAIQIQKSNQPSIQRMLSSRREVSNSFFQIVDSLMKNGLSYEQICKVCADEGMYKFDLEEFVKNAVKLNAVDANRKIDLSFLS